MNIISSTDCLFHYALRPINAVHRCIAQAQTSISDLGPTSMASAMVNMKDSEMETDSLVLEWENLRHVIKDKVILSEVSGRVEAGEMLASEYSTNRASRASNHVEWQEYMAHVT